MITFKPVIRNVRSDGYAAVYIRVTKDRQSDYIKTNYIAKRTQIAGANLRDFSLISKVSVIIDKFINRLNFEDTELWTIKEVVDFLMQENEQISFNDYFNLFVGKMINDGRDSSVANYKTAFNNLKKFAGKEKFYFSDITSKLINAWIDSLKETARVKNLYPTLIGAVFSAGTRHYNDYERGILRIKNQPFMHVKIPDSDIPEKRAIEIEDLKKIFNADVSGCENPELAQFGKDIAMLVFCLAGINAIDLYVMKTHNFVNGKLCYCRSKTKGKRRDKAYIEIAVPERLLPIFKKYKGKNDNLFNFSETLTIKRFTAKLNAGLKMICDLQKTEKATSYTFRHSWATIAQNDCGASIAEVAFALNHSSEYRITKGYIKTDFTPIDKLNEKVINAVFC